MARNKIINFYVNFQLIIFIIFSNTMFGSLTEFLEQQSIPNNQQIIDYKTSDNKFQEQMPIIRKKSSIRKNNTLKESRKNKLVGITQNNTYNASNKKQLLQLFHYNYPMQSQKTANKNVNLSLKTNQQSIRKGFTKQSDYITGRKSVLMKSKQGVSLFQSNNKKYEEGVQNKDIENDQQTSIKLRRQHNLLRAVVRTKARQAQQIPISDYEQSFNRLTSNIQKIKIKPNTIQIDKDKNIDKYGRDMMSAQDIQKQIQDIIPYSSRSLASKMQNSTRSHNNKLSKYKRIQFENCLSWCKKHKKNGDFYENKLGKSDSIQVDHKRSKSMISKKKKATKYFNEDLQAKELIQKRKSIMEDVYHKRSLSSAIA